MNNIKEIVAGNITAHRKRNNLTQIELGEKISYSDKAISRWEKAEVTPDIETLDKLAEVFGIPIAAFFEKDSDAAKLVGEMRTDADASSDAHKSFIRNNKIVIPLLSICGVWVLATAVFVIIHSIIPDFQIWQVFIHAVPASLVIAVVFTGLWGSRFWKFSFISLLMWSLFLSVYFVFLKFNVWLIFTIGAPTQAAIILAGCLRSKKKVGW